jgi:hypothetical protein
MKRIQRLYEVERIRGMKELVQVRASSRAEAMGLAGAGEGLVQHEIECDTIPLCAYLVHP